MSLEKLRSDSQNGLKRKIYSRKNKIKITPERFSELSLRYFKTINSEESFIINIQEGDREDLIYILRCYYRLWITIDATFIITKVVDKKNHPHTPKEFKTDTIMYLRSNSYGTCNYLNGIPLWDETHNKNLRIPAKSCQINYDHIIPLLNSNESDPYEKQQG